jgi:hypothetical protein
MVWVWILVVQGVYGILVCRYRAAMLMFGLAAVGFAWARWLRRH